MLVLHGGGTVLVAGLAATTADLIHRALRHLAAVTVTVAIGAPAAATAPATTAPAATEATAQECKRNNVVVATKETASTALVVVQEGKRQDILPETTSAVTVVVTTPLVLQRLNGHERQDITIIASKASEASE
jgi:hypothetical protein